MSLDAWLVERNHRSGLVQGHAELAILRDIVHALDHVHTQGLLHRDVKPANVFITTHGPLHPAAVAVQGLDATGAPLVQGLDATGSPLPQALLPRAKLGDFGLSVWDIQFQEAQAQEEDAGGAAGGAGGGAATAMLHREGVGVGGGMGAAVGGAMVSRIASFRRATSSTSTRHTSDVGTVTYQVGIGFSRRG